MYGAVLVVLVRRGFGGRAGGEFWDYETRLTIKKLPRWLVIVFFLLVRVDCVGIMTGSLLVSLGHWSMRRSTSFPNERVCERFPKNRQVLSMVSEPSSLLYILVG